MCRSGEEQSHKSPTPAVVRMSTIGLSVYSHLSYEHVWHMTSALTLSASEHADVGQAPMTSYIPVGQTSCGSGQFYAHIKVSD